VADHDHSYKLLFSHAEMVRDLLEGFVKEPAEQPAAGIRRLDQQSYTRADARSCR
jgi:hypothetical protein